MVDDLVKIENNHNCKQTMSSLVAELRANEQYCTEFYKIQVGGLLFKCDLCDGLRG